MSNISDANSIRILLLGDPEVGKTSLMSILSDRKILKSTQRTIGFETSVCLWPIHDTEICIEFLEIGPYKLSETRSSLFSNSSGVIFVHDLSNKKTLKVYKWLEEAQMNRKRLYSDYDLNLNLQIDSKSENRIPLLLVGNKSDVVPIQYFNEYAEEFSCETINLVSLYN